MSGGAAKLLNAIKGRSHATKRAWLASSQKKRASERRLMERERQKRMKERAALKAAEAK